MRIKLAIHHLETLLWIHKLGTFAAAAERMSTTQPTVSVRVKEMESRLGLALFKRQGRRMVLTVRGRKLVEQCEPLLNQLQRVLSTSDDLATFAGTCRLGVGEIAAVSCVPPFVAEVKRELPDVSLEIDVDLTINLRRKLLAGNLDLAVLVGPVDSPFLEASSIGAVPMLWLGARDFVREIENRAVDFRTVLDEAPLWCLTKPSHLYEAMLATLRDNGGSAKNINTCNNVTALIEMILAGAGIGILPEILARPWIDRGELVAFDSGIEAEPVEFFVVIPRSEEDPLLRELFVRASRLRIDARAPRQHP